MNTKVELLLSPTFQAAADRATAERITGDFLIKRQTAIALECKLYFLQRLDWETRDMPTYVLRQSVDMLVARVLFAEHLACAPLLLVHLACIHLTT